MKLVLYSRKNAESITAAHTLWLKYKGEAKFYSTNTTLDNILTPDTLNLKIRKNKEGSYRPEVECGSKFPRKAKTADIYLAGVSPETISYFRFLWQDAYKSITLVDNKGKETVL